MRKERQVILNKMEQLSRQEAAELEMGAGFFAHKIAQAFESEHNKLTDALARTYGLSTLEYQMREMEIGNRIGEQLVADGIIPFN